MLIESVKERKPLSKLHSELEKNFYSNPKRNETIPPCCKLSEQVNILFTTIVNYL